MPVAVLKGIPVSEDSVKIGEEGEEKARLKHQAERGFGHAFFQFPEELIPDPGGGAFFYLFTVSHDGLTGLFFNMESGACGMADDPNHPDRILFEFFIRIADVPDHLSFEISLPAHIINDGEIGNIIKEAIDRDIAAEGILLRRAKAVGPENLPVISQCLFKFGVAPEGGDFHGFSAFKKDVDQPETAANDPAVFEEGIDLMRMGIGGDIKIFRDLSEKKIPDTSPDKIG